MFEIYIETILFYLQQYIDRYSFLVPLGVIGIWRWSVWTTKEIIGAGYKPATKPYKATVSIVTPVYNEDPDVFAKALGSWKANDPNEIIAVIDYTDKKCISIFKEFAKKTKGAILIITKTPGKRPALADGIKKATSEIVVLVDSDTIWSSDVIKNGLPPFNDPKVAGVATYQSVYKPKTFAQKIFDIQLDLRYMHEYPFLAAAGNALICLSGRTAFYRRTTILPMMHDLVHETFLGKPVISGDDKRLTYLVLAAGWKVAYQSNSHVYTPGMKDLSSYMKQRLRWSRNSLRADIKAIFQGWPLKHPALFFFQIDKFLQSFVVILSPIFFIIALLNSLWTAALVLVLWWFVSRSIKMHSHLMQKPQNITIVPGYILYSFVTGIVKIYAFFTLNTQGWITRWDKSRLHQLRFLNILPAYIGTLAVLLILGYTVNVYKYHTYFAPHAEKGALLAEALPKVEGMTIAKNPVLGATIEHKKDLFVKRHIVQEGESIASIAAQYSISADRLFYANSAKLPYEGYVTPGIALSIPGKDIEFDPSLSFSYEKSEDNPYLITYVKSANTIVVMGRGRIVTLKDIQDAIDSEYLTETNPKQWHAKASIYLYHGVTLILDKKEVTWLRLESNKNGFTMLRSLSGDILVNGVKITSWDSEQNDYDKKIEDGRSFIMVKDTGRMDFFDAEVSYLGYPTKPELTVSPYGVSWKMSNYKLKKSLITGEVVKSKFHHNYFGTYTYGATGMLWRNNEFHSNIRYGLDPHDDSNGFLVEGNYAHHNGTHGIIFSKRCMYNTIRNNVSINNGLHGIMLHEKSDNNLIENNTVSDNVSGIAMWRSSNNILRKNTLTRNKHGIRLNENSNNNILQDNKVNESERYGFYLYDNANYNSIYQNTLVQNEVAIYIKSNSNSVTTNTLRANAIGIYFLDSAAQNTASGNSIEKSDVYAIYTKIKGNLENTLGTNTLYRNRKDIEGMELE